MYWKSHKELGKCINVNEDYVERDINMVFNTLLFFIGFCNLLTLIKLRVSRLQKPIQKATFVTLYSHKIVTVDNDIYFKAAQNFY